MLSVEFAINLIALLVTTIAPSSLLQKIGYSRPCKVFSIHFPSMSHVCCVHRTTDNYGLCTNPSYGCHRMWEVLSCCNHYEQCSDSWTIHNLVSLWATTCVCPCVELLFRQFCRHWTTDKLLGYLPSNASIDTYVLTDE